MNNALPKRLNWEQIESRPRQEGRKVVKGTTKRVVVVKSPDPKIFEQAIFIVREDYAGKNGADSSDVLREAQRVADDYVRGSVPSGRGLLHRLPPVVFAAAGAACAALVWLVLKLVGI
jgi:hypothetical protein